MHKDGHRSNTTTIPLGLVRLRVGGEHHRCMADQPVVLVPVSDDGCGYPWWIGPTDIVGIELEPGTAYLLDIAISGEGAGEDDDLLYELIQVVETAKVRSSAIAS